MREPNKTVKKLTGSVITIILLAACLCITTFALIYSTVAAENNLFQTGAVKINWSVLLWRSSAKLRIVSTGTVISMINAIADSE